MKLYMVPLAPNPTKVMLYIAERAERIDRLIPNNEIALTAKRTAQQ